MRLLTHDSHGELFVTEDLADFDIPPYAILSHTWGKDAEEVVLREIGSKSSQRKVGYTKIKFCEQQAQRDGLQYFWVDTCCIDKANHVELSKAITCMYRWYQNAQVCYVYLADVSFEPSDPDVITDGHPTECVWEPSFRKSRWFTRGWTLQELLAPKEVKFYSKEYQLLGTRHSLKTLLQDITGIPILALSGQSLSRFSVTERMRWAQGRVTKEREDQAYSLLGIFNIFMPLIYGEGHNAFVRLMDEINKTHKVMFNLKVAEGATFDSYGQTQRGCHPATRIELLQSIDHWIRDEKGKDIFWVNGMAGTGKSTIAWTFAKKVADLGNSETVALGASFFFKRGEGDRASAALLFPTIASQLANRISGFDTCLAQVVKADPQICTKSLGEQFNWLICEPLRRLGSDRGYWTYAVVVDALDECEDEADIRTVLQLWSNLPVATAVRLRLFLTSRPELVIRLGFKRMSTAVHHDSVLHEVPQLTMHHDILAFLTDALSEVRNGYNLALDDDLDDERLPIDWPGSSALQTLTGISVPLFIVAATIHRLVGRAERPQQYLESILQSRNNIHLSQMGGIYTIVLQAMTTSLVDEQETLRVHHEFQVVVGAIVLLAEPLSRIALAALLKMKPGDVHVRLLPLHAVLQVPSDGNAPIQPLHLSFGEYLTSQEAKNTPYSVDTAATHRSLTRQCLILLSSSVGLRENVCHLSCPGQLRSEVSTAQINKCLPSVMRYACRYWVYHIRLSNSRICDHDEVCVFLQRHFLHWLEALSFMDRLADAIEFVTILQSMLATENSSWIAAFLYDARRFVLANRFVGELAPLQLYSSAIVFAPQNSIVRRVHDSSPAWIRQCPVTPLVWSSELQKLEGHNNKVVSVDISPDGLMLASASSGDNVVRLWNVNTGQEMWKLEGHEVAFSPDSSLLASASSDGVVRLWDVKTGQVVQTLGYPDATSMVLYPNHDSRVASVTYGKITQLWDTDTGTAVAAPSYGGFAYSPDCSQFASYYESDLQLTETKKDPSVWSFTQCTYRILSVSFSSDGSLLAITSGDDLWILHVKIRKQLWRLKGHTDTVCTVAFSSDGSLLASGSYDQTVRLWHMGTGQEVKKLRGHTDMIRSVTFSLDGSLLASASNDMTIRVWDMRTSQVERVQERHNDRVRSVALSPDRFLLASASRDKVVRLWDTKTGQEVRKLEGHTSWVDTVAFSPDGSLLASASFDQTIRLWETKTGRVVQKLERVGYITKLSFSSNFNSLITDRGNFNIVASSSVLPPPCPVIDYGMAINYDWVTCRGQRILWLPHEYRGGVSVISGDLIGIGRLDGCVSILRIQYP